MSAMKNSKGNETMQAKLQRKSTRTMRQAALLLALGGALGAASTRATAQNAAVVYPTDATNIAAASSGGRVLNSTSTLDNDPKFSADNLIDGKVYSAADKSSFGWASNKFDPINLDTVTFGFEGNTLRRIGKIVINPAAAVAPERWAKDIEVQVSTTSAEGPYEPVAQITLKREAVPQSFTILPASARYVRLAIRTNWGSDRAVALGEVEMYEAIDKNDAMGQLIARLESAVTDLRRFRDTQLEVSEATLTRTAASTRAPRGDAEVREIAALAKSEPLNSATLQMVQAMGEAAPTGETALPATGASTRGNIAAASNGGKIVDVTSIFSNDATYGPDKLIDGQNFDLKAGTGSSGWASNSFTPGREWVTVGFADDRTHVIGKVVLNPTSNQPSLRWGSRVDVQVTSGTPKEGPFRTVATLPIRQEASNQEFNFRPVEAKYVRFVFTANGPGNPLTQADPDVSSDRAVSLGEIEIYEPPAGNADLDALIGRFNQVLVDMKRLRAQQSDTK